MRTSRIALAFAALGLAFGAAWAAEGGNIGTGTLDFNPANGGYNNDLFVCGTVDANMVLGVTYELIPPRTGRTLNSGAVWSPLTGWITASFYGQIPGVVAFLMARGYDF